MFGILTMGNKFDPLIWRENIVKYREKRIYGI